MRAAHSFGTTAPTLITVSDTGMNRTSRGRNASPADVARAAELARHALVPAVHGDVAQQRIDAAAGGRRARKPTPRRVDDAAARACACLPGGVARRDVRGRDVASSAVPLDDLGAARGVLEQDPIGSARVTW